MTDQYLQVVNVDETDEGTYLCSIRNAAEVKSASATLTVLSKANAVSHCRIILFIGQSHHGLTACQMRTVLA
jgi:hypothetical protein